jgi:hypothetical protein
MMGWCGLEDAVGMPANVSDIERKGQLDGDP